MAKKIKRASFWAPGAKKQAFYAERARHDRAPNKEITTAATLKLVDLFKKKAVSRLKTFYAESQRMDKKVQEMIDTAESMGFYIDKVELNSVDEEYILNYRKRTKALSFEVYAHRDQYKFVGKLTVSPASMMLRLSSTDLKTIYTKNGYVLDHFRINYYRTMNISDNYLAGLVGGKIEVTDDEAVEVPF